MDSWLNGLSGKSKNPIVQFSINPIMLALTLLVPFIAANHPDDALASDDFAIFAKFLY